MDKKRTTSHLTKQNVIIMKVVIGQVNDLPPNLKSQTLLIIPQLIETAVIRLLQIGEKLMKSLMNFMVNYINQS